MLKLIAISKLFSIFAEYLDIRTLMNNSADINQGPQELSIDSEPNHLTQSDEASVEIAAIVKKYREDLINGRLSGQKIELNKL